MTTDKTKRIQWLDALKLFAMFLVVWGHCIQRFLGEMTNENIVYDFIYSFHMPLFMCISGFFGASLLNLDFKTVLKKKFIQLLLPAISFSLIAALYTTHIGIANSFLSEFKSAFWFLKSAFFCAIIYYTIYRVIFFIIKKSQTYIDILVFIICLLAFSDVGYMSLNTMLPSFILGTILNKYFSYFGKGYRKIIILSAILFFSLYYLSHQLNFSILINTFTKCLLGLIGAILVISIGYGLSIALKYSKLPWGG